MRFILPHIIKHPLLATIYELDIFLPVSDKGDNCLRAILKEIGFVFI